MNGESWQSHHCCRTHPSLSSPALTTSPAQADTAAPFEQVTTFTSLGREWMKKQIKESLGVEVVLLTQGQQVHYTYLALAPVPSAASRFFHYT